jgi:hypothetical protein
MKLSRPVRLSAAAAPALAILLFHVNPAALKTAGSVVVLLAAAVTTAAGLTVAVGRLRLRPPAPRRAPGVRAAPDPGPPGQVSVHDAGPAVARAGIRLLAAGNYPVGSGRAESADDGNGQ